MNRFSDRGSTPLGSTSQYHLNGEIKRYTALVKLFAKAVYGFLKVNEKQQGWWQVIGIKSKNTKACKNL